MNDFLRVEIFSLDEAYLVLMRPGTGELGGAEEISRMKVPYETMKDMVTQDWIRESLYDNVVFAENGIFSCKF
jgi:hypothetical protein